MVHTNAALQGGQDLLDLQGQSNKNVCPLSSVKSSKAIWCLRATCRHGLLRVVQCRHCLEYQMDLSLTPRFIQHMISP